MEHDARTVVEVAPAHRSRPGHVGQQGVGGAGRRRLPGAFGNPLQIAPGQVPEGRLRLAGERQQAGRTRSGLRFRRAGIGKSGGLRKRYPPRGAHGPIVPIGGARRAAVLLQQHVGIRSGNPEGVHARPSRLPASARPLRFLRRHPHRQALPVDARVGIPEVKVLRYHPGLHDQGRLDQPGDSGRRFEMADVGLDGSDEKRAIGFARPAVDRGRGVELDGIAHRGPGAVRLEVVHLRGCNADLGQGRFDHLHQRGRIGHRQSRAGPAVIDRRASDQRPDPITVRFRFAEPLQDHDAAPLAPHIAVCGRVECLALAVRRQHHRIGAQLVHAAIEHGVDAARDRQIRFPLLEIRHRVVDGHQGRGASGVHRLRRPHQTQHE